MANCFIGFPNWINGSQSITPSFSNSPGSWQSGVGFANVGTRFLNEVARSTDATTTNARGRVDLGSTRSVRLIAIPKSNITVDGLVKVTGYSDAGYSTQVETTGWVDYWPDAYPWGTRPWGSYGLFDPKFSPEDLEIYQSTWFYLFDEAVIARYWQFEFDDTANGDGYIEVSRAVLVPGWQPSYNMVPGAEMTVEDTSRIVETMSAGYYWRAGVKRRGVNIDLDLLEEDEMLVQALELALRVGTTQEVFFVFDPDDTAHRVRRSMLARVRVINAIRWPTVNRYASARLEIIEIVA